MSVAGVWGVIADAEQATLWTTPWDNVSLETFWLWNVC